MVAHYSARCSENLPSLVFVASAVTLSLSNATTPVTDLGVFEKGSVNNSPGYALDSTLMPGVTGGSGRCRRLSANHCFVGKPIFSRRGLLRLFVRVAMAGRFLLS